jgi:hypothetical protein
MQVFISYKHHEVDGKIAQEIYDLLRGWGFIPWMDVHDISSGITEGSRGWISAIDKALIRSRVLIGLISDDTSKT